jgi:KipI family sensor histidine kinase inhibitor
VDADSKISLSVQGYGPRALLLKLSLPPGELALRHLLAMQTYLQQHPPAGLREVTPGFNTLLLEFSGNGGENLAEFGEELKARLQNLAPLPLPDGAPIKIPVTYRGPDLERVAGMHSISADEVIQLHTAPTYIVLAIGFSPGFPYLGPLPLALHSPRLPAPRSRVEPGSVAIGGEHTGIYSIASPGGWNIIGHTSTVLFRKEAAKQDSQGADAFLLRPGDRVQFVPT